MGNMDLVVGVLYMDFEIHGMQISHQDNFDWCLMRHEHVGQGVARVACLCQGMVYYTYFIKASYMKGRSHFINN